MNVAILGYGAIAREHALALRRIGQGQNGMRGNLTAVMGRLPARTRAFAEEFGATLATTWGVALNQRRGGSAPALIPSCGLGGEALQSARAEQVPSADRLE